MISAYCKTRWELYFIWVKWVCMCMRGDGDLLGRIQAKKNLEKHMFYCDECREHKRVMDELAMSAEYPDVDFLEIDT